MQAIDRTHRIGQFKPIFATRFIIENSIEERILKLQEKKKLVFDGTVGGIYLSAVLYIRDRVCVHANKESSIIHISMQHVAHICYV